MSVSRKYGRTYHFPFSPGTTSDDRISHAYWEDIQKWKAGILTEKLDGENTCLNKVGVFARSHAAPTLHPWADYLKIKWASIKNDLNDLEIFGENLYAIHSIKYTDLPSHFFVFGVREHDRWLSWEEVKFYAGMLDFPTVPEIGPSMIPTSDKDLFKNIITDVVKGPSLLGSVNNDLTPSTMEGIVLRNTDGFTVEDFKQNVLKYVRKGHVKTDEHWSRKPHRATLISERSPGADYKTDKDKIIS